MLMTSIKGSKAQQPHKFCRSLFSWATPSICKICKDMNEHTDTRKGKKTRLGTFPWRKCHASSCLPMCSSTRAHFANNPLTNSDWCLFSLLSAVQKIQTIKLNWFDGKFSCQVKLCHNGRYRKSRNQCLQRTTRSKEREAAGNRLSQHFDNYSCFSGRRADLISLQLRCIFLLLACAPACQLFLPPPFLISQHRRT